MIYILHGENAYKKEIDIAKLQEKYADYTYVSIDSTDSSIDVVRSLQFALGSISLFSQEGKIIHIKEFQSFPEQAILLQLAEKLLTEISIVIILDSPSTLRSNAKMLRMVPPKQIITEASYTLEELHILVEKTLNEADIANSKEISNYILDHVSPDPYMLIHEAQKVALYPQRDTLPLEDIVTSSLQSDIWVYLGLVVKGDKIAGVKILSGLLEKGENAYGILGLLTWNIRLLTILQMTNKSEAIIAKDFGYSPYAVRKAGYMRSHYPLKRLKVMYDKLVELEYKMKNGLIEEKLGLLLFSFLF